MRTINNLITGTGLYWRKSAPMTFLQEIYRDIRSSQQNIRIMRFAVGITLAVVMSSAIDWPLSFLVPLLVSIMLAIPMPIPSLKAGLTNMLHTLGAFFIGLLFTLFLLPFQMAYFPMLGLVLFHLYYLLNRGGPFWFVLLSLLAVLVLPMLGSTAEGLASGFAVGFILSGWVTVLMVWLAYLLVPDPVGTPALPKKPGTRSGYHPLAAQVALKSTIAILPVVMFFIVFDLTSQLLVMVFAAIFTLSPEVSKGRAAGTTSLKSTLIGGTLALFFYYLIVAVPQYHFFLVLIFLVALFIGSNIFSGKASAVYYGAAFSAFYVLINSNLAAGSEFTSAFFLRVLFIFMATVYVVLSLMVLERFWPQRAKQ
ncbi:MAG: DUF2955 domain-containing protein [Thiohalomonadales bacterium]